MRKSASPFLHVLLACLAAAGCSPADPTRLLEHATLLAEPRTVADFRLTDQRSAAFTQEDFRDRWHILFTGFTHCPDICPTTLALLASVQQRAGIDPEHLGTVFVSVDPGRDTPENLAEYVGHFDPEWTALTGPTEELRRLLDSLELAYVKVPTGPGEYTMDHSTALVLIDPEGRMRAYYTAPLDAAALAGDLGKLAGSGR